MDRSEKILRFPYINDRWVDLVRSLQPTDQILNSLKASFPSSSSAAQLMSNLSLSDDSDPPKDEDAMGGISTLWGMLKFTINNDEYDCSEKWVRLPHPHFIYQITSMETTASFILLVHKPDPFSQLGSYGFFKEFGCILLHYNGDPWDKSTVIFLRKMKREFNINLPVLAFVDWSPKGLKLVHELKKSVPTLDILWLGLKNDDFDKYKIPKQYRKKMSTKDINMAQELEKDGSFQKNSGLLCELKQMMLTKLKHDQSQIVYTGGLLFLPHCYLTHKLQQHDWERLIL